MTCRSTRTWSPCGRSLKFYRAFNRFAMKCFLHEALTFWEYAAWRCIIDNTNLARLCGGGSAVIVPEMREFARARGFNLLAMRVGGGRWLVQFREVAGWIRDGLIAAKRGGSNYAGR